MIAAEMIAAEDKPAHRSSCYYQTGSTALYLQLKKARVETNHAYAKLVLPVALNL
jgi:hypothetical protein